MTLRFRRLLSPFIAVVAMSVAACGGDGPTAPPTPPTPPGGQPPPDTATTPPPDTGTTTPPSSSLSFDYSIGGSSQTFTAEGEIERNADQSVQFGTWAAAARRADSLNVVAFQAGTEPRGDVLVLFIPNVAAGQTFQFAGDCTQGAATCVEGDLAVNFNLDPPTSEIEADRLCTFTAGSVSISSLTAERVQGSFSGSGTCTNPEAAFTVTNGVFDTPFEELAAPSLSVGFGGVEKPAGAPVELSRRR